VTNGLGFLPYANGVRYDSEARRRPLVHRLVAAGTMGTPCTTTEVESSIAERELIEAVSEQAGKAAYVVAPRRRPLRNEARHDSWASAQVSVDR
jgi:hypothetical protein